MQDYEFEFTNTFSVNLYTKSEKIVKIIRRKKIEQTITLWSATSKGEYTGVEAATMSALSNSGGCIQEGAALKLLIAVTALPISHWPDKREIHGYLFPQSLFGDGGSLRGWDQWDLLENIHCTPNFLALETLHYIESKKGFKDFQPSVNAARKMIDKIDRSLLVELTKKVFFCSPPLTFGWPDLTFVKNGKVEVVEVKSPNDRVRESQAKIAKIFRNIDGINISLAKINIINSELP